MKPNWILEVSPLIIFGKAGLLKTISPLAACWLIPEGVVREVSQKYAMKSSLHQIYILTYNQ